MGWTEGKEETKGESTPAVNPPPPLPSPHSDQMQAAEALCIPSSPIPRPRVQAHLSYPAVYLTPSSSQTRSQLAASLFGVIVACRVRLSLGKPSCRVFVG